MTPETNGAKYRLDELERRVRHLEERGSRIAEQTAWEVKAQKDAVHELARELREDIADCRRGFEAEDKRIWVAIDGVKGTLGRGAWTLLGIPVAIVTAILIFWIQNQ